MRKTFLPGIDMISVVDRLKGLLNVIKQNDVFGGGIE
jgi:hypothetical protein